MATKPRIYSRLCREALALLGKQIRLARKERRMSEMDLAARIGIARSTLQRIEKGEPAVEIGFVFEAAALTGVDLFVPEATTLRPQLGRIDDRLAGRLTPEVRESCASTRRRRVDLRPATCPGRHRLPRARGDPP